MVKPSHACTIGEYSTTISVSGSTTEKSVAHHRRVAFVHHAVPGVAAVSRVAVVPRVRRVRGACGRRRCVVVLAAAVHSSGLLSAVTAFRQCTTRLCVPKYAIWRVEAAAVHGSLPQRSSDRRRLLMHTRRFAAALLALFLMAVGWTVAVPSAHADAPVEGRTGRAELRFMEGMIDHHQMAIDMANDCLARAVSEGLRAECQAVIDTQQPEIEQMQAWLLAWYNVQYAPMSMADMEMMDGMAGMDHSGMDHDEMPMDDGPYTDPPMMMGMFAGFNRLEGTAYEMAWLESMIDHHDDAIHMAERLLQRDAEGAGHAELRALAEAIIAAQTAEITTYETMLQAMGSE
jgi:uncharacterized protein (DUF305 family)